MQPCCWSGVEVPIRVSKSSLIKPSHVGEWLNAASLMEVFHLQWQAASSWILKRKWAFWPPSSSKAAMPEMALLKTHWLLQMLAALASGRAYSLLLEDVIHFVCCELMKACTWDRLRPQASICEEMQHPQIVVICPRGQQSHTADCLFQEWELLMLLTMGLSTRVQGVGRPSEMGVCNS